MKKSKITYLRRKRVIFNQIKSFRRNERIIMTLSKRKKIRLKVLKSLDILEEGELSKNKGGYLPSPPKPNKKSRRHSGRITPKIIDKSMKYNEMKEQALCPEIEYDDWQNYRDSFRGNGDIKKLRKSGGKYCIFNKKEREEINKKLKKLIERRKLKKRWKKNKGKY